MHIYIFSPASHCTLPQQTIIIVVTAGIIHQQFTSLPNRYHTLSAKQRQLIKYIKITVCHEVK